MKVIDSWSIRGMTLLTLSGSIPNGGWRHVVIGGESFKPIIPMYAGDVSRVKNNAIGIDGTHDFTGKTVEFV